MAQMTKAKSASTGATRTGGRRGAPKLGQAHPAWAADAACRTGDTRRRDSRDPFSLLNRNALVTGAARGIGLAVAERLAVLGAYVILADINEDGLRKHPFEVANVVAFLASDASSAVTGRLIMADGGITIW